MNIMTFVSYLQNNADNKLLAETFSQIDESVFFAYKNAIERWKQEEQPWHMF